MNIVQTKITIVPETGVKRIISLKLMKPKKSGNGYVIETPTINFRCTSKHAQYIINVQDEHGKTPRDVYQGANGRYHRAFMKDTKASALDIFFALTSYYEAWTKAEEEGKRVSLPHPMHY
jgi:hypothetical protein